MSAPRALFGSALDATLSAVLPAISKVPNERLLKLVPPVAVPGVSGGVQLRELAGKNLAVVNFLRHLSSRGEDAEFTKARVKSYVVNPRLGRSALRWSWRGRRKARRCSTRARSRKRPGR